MANDWFTREQSAVAKSPRRVTAAIGETKYVHIPNAINRCVITVDPVGTASVEYSYDENYDTVNANWTLWDAGAAVAVYTESVFLVAPTMVRVTTVVGGDAILKVISGGK